MITCFFENGQKAQKGLRHVTVGTIAVNPQNQVLLVKRASDMPNGGLFAIPGGFLDRDETAHQAALRELKEETGFSGQIDALFRINDNPDRPKEDRQNIDLIYIVTVNSGEPILNKEVSQITWFFKEDLPPEEEFAFDHREVLLRYYAYRIKKFPLPIIGQ